MVEALDRLGGSRAPRRANRLAKDDGARAGAVAGRRANPAAASEGYRSRKAWRPPLVRPGARRTGRMEAARRERCKQGLQTAFTRLLDTIGGRLPSCSSDQLPSHRKS